MLPGQALPLLDPFQTAVQSRVLAASHIVPFTVGRLVRGLPTGGGSALGREAKTGDRLRHDC